MERGEPMGETSRFGVSMDHALLELLDKLSLAQGHTNRSETIRSLVRKELIDQGSLREDREVVGVLSLTYRYDTRLPRAPIETYPSVKIVTNIQVHIEKDICMKVLIVRGTGNEIRKWSKKLLSRRDVIGRLNLVATDELYTELRDA